MATAVTPDSSLEEESLATTVTNDSKRDGEDSIKILFEIVGAEDLTHDPNDQLDQTAVNPFCVVTFGGERIHKTKPAETLNPIWTVDTDSLFILSTSPSDLAHHKVTIQLWTKQSTFNLSAGKAFLGQVHLDSEKISAHYDEKRFEVEVEDEVGEETGLRGTLALRLRMATAGDIKFLRYWNKRKINKELAQKAAAKALLEEEETICRPRGVLITEKDEAQVAGASFLNALTTTLMAVQAVTSPRQRSSGQVKVRIKPGPDPKRPEETTYMTPHEVSIETRKPSQSWVQAGSGTVGRLYLEVLSCHDLPNVDVGEAVGNVTDSFVTAIFEDTVVQTPVIDDELSPHWLPWTQRAFCFKIMHPASMLYLGVFDFDLGPMVDHEPIGRVAVNISNLQRDTQYVLKYSLYPSSNVTERKPNGVITIRLRVELNDEKAALMAALRPRPKIHVNVTNRKSFKVVRYTCFGQHDDENKFDLDVTKSYVNEIFEYKRALGYAISDSIGSLIFWRGQVKVFSLRLPIYSFCFFCCASALVEKPQLGISFFLLFLGGIMLANMGYRQQNPSPWNRCPTFYHYLSILAKGKSHIYTHRIDVREGAEDAALHDLAWEKRLERDLKTAEKTAELRKELESVGDDTIQTVVTGGIPLDLIAKLGRWQGLVGEVCKFFRFIKIILTWEESIVSFWITAVLIGSGLVTLLLPWGFILRWTGRTIVYCFLGPQMKIVDLYLRANNKDDFKKAVDSIKSQHQAARIRREDALKLKAIKCLRFGEYITRVPAFNLARHYDRPLAESSAKYVRKGPIVPSNSSWIPGQQLYGDMIPRPEKAFKNNEEQTEKERDRMTSLEGRMVALRAAARLTIAKQKFLRLKNMPLEEDEPESIGYELVQWEGSSSNELVPAPGEHPPQEVPMSESFDGMNLLCVVPYQNTKGSDQATKTESTSYSRLLLEGSAASSPGGSTQTPTWLLSDNSSLTSRPFSPKTNLPRLVIPDDLSIQADMPAFEERACDESTAIMSFDGGQSSYPTEVVNDEEGVEVVAWGRFRFHTDDTDDEDEKKIDDSNALVPHGAQNLSVLVKESDSTFVAYYRP